MLQTHQHIATSLGITSITTSWSIRESVSTSQSSLVHPQPVTETSVPWCLVYWPSTTGGGKQTGNLQQS